MPGFRAVFPVARMLLFQLSSNHERAVRVPGPLAAPAVETGGRQCERTPRFEQRARSGPGEGKVSRAAIVQDEHCQDEELVNQYAALVKRIARHVLSRLPASVHLDDLVQAGLIGLMEAARLYDPSQGASFETYATIRVRGAMLDELRRNDWSPRSLSKRVRQLSEAAREIENRRGRPATAQEIAAHLGLSLDEYHQWVLDASNQNFFSLDSLEEFDGAPNPGADSTYRSVENDRRRLFLVEAIGSLSEREQIVLSLYYDKDLTLKEIGEVLGVSESRVCQIHGEAAVRLKSRMSSWR